MYKIKITGSMQKNALIVTGAACLLMTGVVAQADTGTYTLSYPTSGVYGGNDGNPINGGYNVLNSFLAINNNGTIAGTINDTNLSGAGHGGFAGSSAVIYGDGSNSAGTVVSGINSAGGIVGTYTIGVGTSSFYSNAANYGSAAPTVTLVDNNLHGSTNATTVVGGINDAGTAVGVSTLRNGSQYIFEYNTTTSGYTDLAFGISGASSISANAISSNGYIAGTYVDTNGIEQGYVYDGSTWTSITDPNVLGNTTNLAELTVVTGVNKLGEVVGYYQDANGLDHGFVYDLTNHNFGTNNVNASIDDPNSTQSNTQIFGINDKGTIVGTTDGTWGFVGTAQVAAVPVPGAFWLMSSALAGFGFIKRRKV
ncbi:VPLPA-CTERM sorting domain-containing protein [Methylomonas sp. AM2-LC]|uniref:VPLPA-CTERM sorting domain-containing protein n=1 Tax=Methylomonas sp. AM2-LC TaxID=3153301 RepID=UPI0032634A34